MDFIKEMGRINKIAIKSTFEGLKKNWMIILTGFLYTILTIVAFFIQVTFLRGVFSILSGLFTWLFLSSLISNYLTLLEVNVRGGKINFEIFKEGFKVYVWKIYGIFFFLYLTNMILGMLSSILNLNPMTFSLVFQISIFILLNAIPETLYLTNYDPANSIKYTLNFMKENWLQWAIPNIIIFALFYLVAGDFFTKAILGGAGFIFNVKSIIIFIINQILLAIFMVYRGNLFLLLNNKPRFRIY